MQSESFKVIMTFDFFLFRVENGSFSSAQKCDEMFSDTKGKNSYIWNSKFLPLQAQVVFHLFSLCCCWAFELLRLCFALSRELPLLNPHQQHSLWAHYYAKWSRLSFTIRFLLCARRNYFLTLLFFLCCKEKSQECFKSKRTEFNYSPFTH